MTDRAVPAGTDSVVISNSAVGIGCRCDTFQSRLRERPERSRFRMQYVLGRPPSNAAPKAPIHCGKRCRQYFEGAQPSNRPSKVTGTSIRSYSSDIEQECLDRWGVEYTKWFFLKSQARSFSLFLFLFRQILNSRKRRRSNRHLICRHDCGQSKSRKNHSLCDRPGIAYRDEYNFCCPAEETIPAENRAASSFHCRFECPLSPGGLVQSAGRTK